MTLPGNFHAKTQRRRASQRWIATIVIFAAIALAQQRTMTVAQVKAFVRSSIEQKLDDKQVAEILRKTRLTEKLELPSVAELQAMGAGPKTSGALHDLAIASETLPPPSAAPQRPVTRVTSTGPPPDSTTQAAILDKIRDYANNYTASLPNFICTQVTRRQVDASGTGDHYQSVDKLQEQLTYFDHHENYKVVMVNGQMVQNKEHEKLGGAVTSGEFGSIMAEIFVPDTEAEFDWDHLGKWDGRIVNVFRYRVRQPLSHYSIEHVPSNRTIIAGYHGRIWADAETSAVRHVTLECDDIPRDFPIQDVTTELTYDVAKISEQEYILPLKWEMHSRDGKYLVWNSAEYALYRKFGTTSTLTFDAPDPVPDSKTKEEPVAPPVKKKQ